MRLPAAGELALEDKWILTRFEHLTAAVRENIDSYELGVALGKIYDFVWDIFCDWYIELVKPRLSAGDAVAQNVISYVLSETLKLLHPFMPFITEEIWQSLPHEGESIMISRYPVYEESLVFDGDAEKLENVISCIRAIRNRRAEMNVPPSRKASVYVVTSDPETFGSCGSFFVKLASASEMKVVDGYDGADAVQIVSDTATVYIPLSEVIDLEKELARLEGERKKTDGEIARIGGKLANEGFISKAPAAVIEGERKKLEGYKAALENINRAIEKITSAK